MAGPPVPGPPERRPGLGRPLLTQAPSPAARAGTWPPGAAEPAPRPGLGRPAVGPVLRRPAPDPGPVPTPAAPTVARAAAEPGGADDPGAIAVAAGLGSPAPDGSVVFGPPPGAAHVARQADGTTPTPAAGPGPGAGAGAERPDLAALADDLYERIEQRLRSDLLLERERRGALPDL